MELAVGDGCQSWSLKLIIGGGVKDGCQWWSLEIVVNGHMVVVLKLIVEDGSQGRLSIVVGRDGGCQR